MLVKFFCLSKPVDNVIELNVFSQKPILVALASPKGSSATFAATQGQISSYDLVQSVWTISQHRVVLVLFDKRRDIPRSDRLFGLLLRLLCLYTQLPTIPIHLFVPHVLRYKLGTSQLDKTLFPACQVALLTRDSRLVRAARLQIK